MVEYPIDLGHGIKTLNDVSMKDQIGLASLMQAFWADN